MADELNILLGTKLDDSSKSITELNKQITELSAKVKSLKINIEVDDKVIRSLNDKIDNLRQQFNLNVAFNTNNKSVSDTVSTIKKMGDELENHSKALLQEEKYFNRINKTVLMLKENIRNLSITKGIDTESFAEDFDRIQKLMFNMKSMDINSDLYAQTKVDLDAIIKKIEYKQTLDKNQLAELKKQEDIYIRIDKQLANLNDIKVKNDKYDVDEYNKIAEGYEKIRQAVQNGSMSYAQADTELKKLTATTKQFEVNAKSASNTTNAFSDTFKRFISYFSIAKVINLTTRAIKEMVGTVFELDSALVELRKVTDFTGDSLNNFINNAYRLGQEISKSGKEVIEASTEFAKAGYSEQDLLPLAKSALVLTSIGDGIKNVEESANTIISVLRGFGKDISEVTNILDVVNNVSNNSAQSFDDITLALQRMSGVMNASNVTMEDSISMFVTINEVLRNAEMSSTALNTISMRIRGLSEDGEAIDGLVPKLQKIYKTFTGIDLTDSTGQVKNLTEVTSELNKVWENLTENEKQYIAQETAGVRQAKAFLTLMDNYNRVLEVNGLAYNSAGSAMKEFTKWQDSLEGKMNNLESAIERFSTNALNSNFIKGIIDATTSIINFADACGGLVPVLLSVGTVLTSLKLISLIKDIDTLTGVTLKLVGVVKGLGAFGTLGIAGIAVTGIMGIAYAFNKLKNSAEEAINKAKEKITELNDELSNINSSRNTFNNLSNEYNTLVKNTNKTTEETKRFYEVQNQLKEILPTLNGYYDEQGNFIITNANNTYELNKQMEEYIRLKKEELALNSQKTASATVNIYNEQKKQIEEITQLINTLNKTVTETGFIDVSKVTKEEESQYYILARKYGNNIDNLTEKLKTLKNEFANTTSTMQSDVLNIVSATEQWTNATEEQRNAIREVMSSRSAEYLAYWSENLANGKLTMDDFMLSMRVLIPNLKELGNVAKESGKDVGDTFVELSKRIDKFNATASTMNKVNDILQSLNENGALTSSEISSLLEISEDYISVLGNESALREKLTQTLKDYKEQHRQAYYEMIKDSTEYYNSLVNDNVGVYNELLNKLQKYINDKGIGYNVDLKNYRTVEEAKLEITKDLIKKVAGVWAKYFNETTGALQNITEEQWNNLTDKQKAQLGKVTKSLYEITQDISEEFKDIALDKFEFKLDSDIKTSKSTEKLKSQLELITEEYEKQNQLLEDRLKYLNVEQSKYSDDSEEYAKIEREKASVILVQQELLAKQIEKLRRSNIEGAKEEAKELERVALDLTQDLININNKLKDISINQYKAEIDAIKEKQDALKTMYDYVQDMIKQELKDRKDALNEEKKAIQEVFDKKKQLLREEREFEDYNANVADKSKNIANLESQLALLKKTGIMTAEQKKIEEELAKARKDLVDYQKDYSYKQAENALDKELEKQLSVIDTEMEAIEEKLNNKYYLEKETNKRIAQDNKKLYEQLEKYMLQYTDLSKIEITDMWENGKNALLDYNDGQLTVTQTLENMIVKIKEATNAMIKLQSMSYDDYSSSQGMSSSSSIISQMKSNSAKWWEVSSTAEKSYLEKRNEELAEQLRKMGLNVTKKNGRWYLGDVPLYHTGGIVGGDGFATKSTEQLAKLLKGELVINDTMARQGLENITKNTINNSPNVEVNINIEGNADESIVSKLKGLAPMIAEEIAKVNKKAQSNSGYKRKLSMANV